AGLSDKPGLTITSAPADDGETVWNIGGELAESGTRRAPEEQRDAARRALAKALPWLDLAGTRLSTGAVDRAEPLMPAGKRPDLPYVRREGSVYVCWPTKLAFAPRLAAEVIASLRESDIHPGREAVSLPEQIPAPPLATPPWEEADREWFPV
ncbi:MAG: glycerol-3-phosphate dehydrogenase, partial [Phycisphaerales bacterium JB038]